MARRRFKRSFIVTVMILLFFIIYFVVFTLVSKSDKTLDGKVTNQHKQVQPIKDNRSLLEQISDSEKVYITDHSSDYLKIDPSMWAEFKDYFSEFKKVRKTNSDIKATYEGHNESGVKFETDLSYFKVFTVKEEEYYKIPITEKKQIDNLIKKLMYTSFNYVNNYKDWGEVSVSDGTEIKSVYFWKKADLAQNIVYKRVVGKVQPEKAFERTKRNFTIKISNKKSDMEIVTMGKDYIKITVEGHTAYYEVSDSLYKYLDEEVLALAK